MSVRREFVALASNGAVSRREACRRYGITPRTGYKWLGREAAGEALADRSRRPKSSPRQTAVELEGLVLAMRERHPTWGGRKLRALLLAQGATNVPAASTITEILRRQGLLGQGAAVKRDWQRFEAEYPNALWQMDFKGHFATLSGRCHPLTVLDDHSRYNLVLEACPDERGQTVKERLTACFRCYGMPARILTDNGSPWGSDSEHGHSPLTVWLIRVGVEVPHGRPYHPQTQGKEERFHRTLKADLLANRTFSDLGACQDAFSAWRQIYNFERPHEALGMEPPAKRYKLSPRPFPETLPPIEYEAGEIVRKVQQDGDIYFDGRRYRVPRAFRGHPVALRPTEDDGIYAVVFCQQQVATIDLRA
jgi:transposase InsO family protein